MNSTLGLALVAALLLFWAVGAYNRLVRLRAAAIQAFTSMDERLRLYIGLIQTGLQHPQAGAPGGLLSGLLASVDQFETSLKVARLKPLDEPSIGALVMALQALNDNWEHLRGEPPDLAGAPLPEALQLQWQQIAEQVEEVRAQFNQCVQDYNQAIRLFPARLLAGLFRFRRAHTI